MRFSVLMTLYDKECPQYLDLSLNSVLVNQTTLPDQFVMVYDGPISEQLDRVVQHYKSIFKNRFDILRLPQNAGQGSASKAGFRICQHELIARMDSDDISMPNRFEQELNAFMMNSDIDIVGGFIAEFTDDPNAVTGIRALPEKHEEIVKLFKWKNPMNNVTVMFRRRAVCEIGGYSNLRTNEDFNLYIRLLLDGKRFYNIQNVLVKVRTGNQMMARRSEMDIFYAWKKNQMLLLKGRVTNRFEYNISCLMCYLFVICPIPMKTIVYKYLLRRKQLN